ncbi:MAG: cupredoxin family copper-binding protein [Candidatus Eremiobacteraeota bacterium]|nr:cupredoxin family copper-binding protein [Candidatus Eremiobacteraeota bacterium]
MNHFFVALLAAQLLLPALALSTPTVEIKNDAYSPPTLTIRAGETVTFSNEDDDAHTVTATDGSFDSKGLDTGGIWRHKFDKPGAYAYFCELHPFMKGTIVVKAVTP